MTLCIAGAASAEVRRAIEDVPTALRIDPAGRPLDAKQWERLCSGQVISQLLESAAGETREGLALAIIDASPARVFQVLRDYAHFSEFMPHVAGATVDLHENNRYLVSYVIHGALGMGNRTYQLEVFDEHEQIGDLDILISRFAYTGKGTIVANRGSWRIVPIAGGTASFVRYSAKIDPGGSLTTWIKARGVAAGIVDAVKAVRERATQRR